MSDEFKQYLRAKAKELKDLVYEKEPKDMWSGYPKSIDKLYEIKARVYQAQEERVVDERQLGLIEAAIRNSGFLDDETLWAVLRRLSTGRDQQFNALVENAEKESDSLMRAISEEAHRFSEFHKEIVAKVRVIADVISGEAV